MEVDKGCPMIRMGVSGLVFLLVPATWAVPHQQPLNGCVCVFTRGKSDAASGYQLTVDS